MPRHYTGNTLVIASHNAGKVKEIGVLLANKVPEVKSAGEFGLDEPEETGSTFLDNADIKSRYVTEYTGLISLSDDSGLVVPALGGEPGIYSARWAGPDKDFALAMEKVRQALIKATGTDAGHQAHFVCALSLCWPDLHVEHVEGKVYGTLVFPPRGNKGFGYDPIFLPDGHTLTFGEMAPEEKHAISHRADAFNRLLERCFA